MNNRISAQDFLSRRLSKKSRPGHAALVCCRVDLIDKSFVQGNIDPDGTASIGEQWDGEQHRALCNGFLNVLVTSNLIDRTCLRNLAAGAFKRFHVLTKSCAGIRHSFFQRLTGRKAAFHIRKPDTEGTVGIFRSLQRSGTTSARYFPQFKIASLPACKCDARDRSANPCADASR